MKGRFPALRPEENMVAVWEPRAGILFPDRCIESHLKMAQSNGASLRFEEAVLRWEAKGDRVRVFSAKNQYEADHLLITAGAWIKRLAPELGVPFTVERQILFWFEPVRNSNLFRPETCPIHLWEYGPEEFFYGFPDLGTGVKVARHHQGELTEPDKVQREVGSGEVETMRRVVRRFLPDADGALRNSTVCLYTNTPDHHFFIDAHPHHPQVLIASPCSGHGFKFSSVIGEILSDIIISGKSSFDLSLFQSRFF